MQRKSEKYPKVGGGGGGSGGGVAAAPPGLPRFPGGGMLGVPDVVPLLRILALFLLRGFALRDGTYCFSSGPNLLPGAKFGESPRWNAA